jgi:hypothetical protein
VESIDPNGAADAIRVFICNSKSTVPAISAIVNMPMSELLGMLLHMRFVVILIV